MMPAAEADHGAAEFPDVVVNSIEPRVHLVSAAEDLIQALLQPVETSSVEAVRSMPRD